MAWRGYAGFEKRGKHHYVLKIHGNDDFSFVAYFADNPPGNMPPDAAGTIDNATAHWKQFWTRGGAIDLSESTDPRADELERRIVLSRYLTAIQTAGPLPPAETGLTCNSWYGKFHLEMHWWHGVHYVLWGKPALFEKSLPWYETVMPQARENARRQGYDGVRWPKMTSYPGHESPSTICVMTLFRPSPEAGLYLTTGSGASRSGRARPDKASRATKRRRSGRCSRRPEPSLKAVCGPACRRWPGTAIPLPTPALTDQ